MPNNQRARLTGVLLLVTGKLDSGIYMEEK
jgi:hypothetical protein